MTFEKIKPEELTENTFELIGKRWMLITAGGAEGVGTMTASWGGLGVLWHLPVATAYVRPSRYTYEFMEKSEYFTLSFYNESFRPKLAICGSKSGRDIDKVKECGLTPVFPEEGGVYFAEAELALVCRKLYHTDLVSGAADDPRVEEYFGAGDCHRLYIGEIVSAYQTN